MPSSRSRSACLFLIDCLILIVLSPFASAQAALAAQVPTQPTRFSVVVDGPPAGKAPDVLLIPGLASSRDVYAAEVKLLAPSYRLHRIQIAGFAGEPAGPNASGPILAPVVEQLHRYIVDNHLQHLPVIGHSLGGLLGLMLADAHPEDVGKLLIVDAFPFYGVLFGPATTVDAMRPQAQAFRDAFIAMAESEFAENQQIYASRLVISAANKKAVCADAMASDRKVTANALYEDMTTDLRPRLALIKTPATILIPYMAAQGAKESVEAPYAAAYAGMPNVHFTLIDNSMHFVMLDQPVAFHAAVMSFLGGAAKSLP